MIRHLLNVTLTVYRPEQTSDGRGGTTVEYVSQGDIRAMVSRPSPEERVAAEQAGSRISHVVYTTHGADVVRGDQLDGDGIPFETATRLRVLAAISNSRTTYLRLECEAVQIEPYEAAS
ncbi:MAG: phage head closure protein [Solirubrobacterales bacterium]|nr:phage head closure protein [Solirubrobacterales bacterium]